MIQYTDSQSMKKYSHMHIYICIINLVTISIADNRIYWLNRTRYGKTWQNLYMFPIKPSFMLHFPSYWLYHTHDLTFPNFRQSAFVKPEKANQNMTQLSQIGIRPAVNVIEVSSIVIWWLTHWGPGIASIRWVIKASVQVMACRLFADKPLFEAILYYSQLNP